MIRDSLKLMQQTPSDRFRFVGLESLTFASSAQCCADGSSSGWNA